MGVLDSFLKKNGSHKLQKGALLGIVRRMDQTGDIKVSHREWKEFFNGIRIPAVKGLVSSEIGSMLAKPATRTPRHASNKLTRYKKIPDSKLSSKVAAELKELVKTSRPKQASMRLHYRTNKMPDLRKINTERASPRAEPATLQASGSQQHASVNQASHVTPNFNV